MKKSMLSLAAFLLLAAGSLGSPSAYAGVKKHVHDPPSADWLVYIRTDYAAFWFGEVEFRVESFQIFEAPDVACGGFMPSLLGRAKVVPTTNSEYSGQDIYIDVDRELAIGTRLRLDLISESSVTHCPETSERPCQCNGSLYRDATILNRKP